MLIGTCIRQDSWLQGIETKSEWFQQKLSMLNDEVLGHQSSLVGVPLDGRRWPTGTTPLGYRMLLPSGMNPKSRLLPCATHSRYKVPGEIIRLANPKLSVLSSGCWKTGGTLAGQLLVSSSDTLFCQENSPNIERGSDGRLPPKWQLPTMVVQCLHDK